MIDTDTIAAISTPLGEGGIGIIKISGTEALHIAEKVFRPTRYQRINSNPRKLIHGNIITDNGQVLDEVLLSFMPAPNTYTREDIVEINCHSGIIALRTTLRMVLDSGARMAEPGEFTKRAFLNGRIDLSQAEAVINIIKAKSEEAVKTAARIIGGELAQRTKELRDRIINLRAPLEAMLDYPEEFDGELLSEQELSAEITLIKEKVVDLLRGSDASRAYQEGVSLAIVGRPNVGKSSLLNALLRQQKAIVHDRPGTTRDLLEGFIAIGGYPLRLIDTAGIQGTDDPVEREGIERSKRAASEARLIIFVLDGSMQWTDDDDSIAAMKRNEQGLVIVINKSDLSQQMDINILKEKYNNAAVVQTSALKEEGIRDLEFAVTEQLDGLFGSMPESPVVVSIRNEEILEEALGMLDKISCAVGMEPLEIISSELNQVWLKIGEITGETMNDDLLNRVFSQFCLGK